MWIQVRSFDGKKSKQIDNLSKLTKIEDLRDLLVEHFDAPVDHQRLFFRGKQVPHPLVCPAPGFIIVSTLTCSSTKYNTHLYGTSFYSDEVERAGAVVDWMTPAGAPFVGGV